MNLVFLVKQQVSESETNVFNGVSRTIEKRFHLQKHPGAITDTKILCVCVYVLHTGKKLINSPKALFFPRIKFSRCLYVINARFASHRKQRQWESMKILNDFFKFLTLCPPNTGMKFFCSANFTQLQQYIVPTVLILREVRQTELFSAFFEGN